MDSNVFKNYSFVFIWLGNAISELGGAFGTLCNSILVFKLTGSTLALGSMWLLYFIPSLVLQLFIGPFIDIWSRKIIMIVSQLARGIVFLFLLFIVVTGNLQIWHVYVVQMIVGLISPIYTPANQAITPTIVSRDQLHTANALLDGTIRLMTFLAPVIGGVVIEYIGVNVTLLIVCIFLLLSGVLLLFIHETKNTLSIRKTWLESFTEGISYFIKQRTIVWLGVFLAIVQFGVGVTMVINLPYITKELLGDYSQYGYFMAGFPLGYVLGSLFVSKVRYSNRRNVMLGALVVGGTTFIALSITSSITFAIATEMVAGIAMSFFSIHNLTLCQQNVPNELFGKVASVRLFIIRGSMPLGVLVGSLLSELWDLRQLYLMIGLIICITSLLGMYLPYFKFLEDGEKKENVSLI